MRKLLLSVSWLQIYPACNSTLKKLFKPSSASSRNCFFCSFSAAVHPQEAAQGFSAAQPETNVSVPATRCQHAPIPAPQVAAHPTRGKSKGDRAFGDWQTRGSHCSGTWWLLIMPGSPCHPLPLHHSSRELCFPGRESPLLSLLVPSLRQLCLLRVLALASKPKLLGRRYHHLVSLCGFKIWGCFIFRILQQPQRWWQGGDDVSSFKHILFSCVVDSEQVVLILLLPGKEWKLYW